MNRASVFEWHKRFKEGRRSVRDDERFGRSKEVRTPELIGQLKNFMDKDHCVSIETISALFDVSLGTVHTIIREEPKMRKICPKFVPRVIILVTNYLTKIGIKTVLHPPYSPDLAPCDFWLFPKLKEKLMVCTSYLTFFVSSVVFTDLYPSPWSAATLRISLSLSLSLSLSYSLIGLVTSFNHVWSTNSLVAPIPAKVCNWFEFSVFLLL